MKSESLKIGLIANSLNSPEWVHDVIRQVQNSGIMELKLVLIKPDKAGENNYSNIKASRLFSKLMSLYLYAEKTFVSVKQDSTKHADLSYLTKDIKTITIEDRITGEQKSEVAGLNMDVLLNIDQHSVPAELTSFFSLGVAYNEITYPDSEVNLPIEWFVMNNYPCIEAKFLFWGNRHVSRKILSQLCFSQDSLFINRVKSQYFWKASLLTMRGLTEIYNLKNNGYYKNEKNKFIERVFNKEIYSLSCSMIIKHVLKYIKKEIDNKFHIRQWIILYNENSTGTEAIEDYKKIIPPKKNFWADPHVIKRNGSHFIFIEEYTYETSKGHLAVLEIDKNGKISKPVKILEKPYHLSYPFLFEYGDELYMIPESEQNETVDIYKCTEFPYKWEFYKHIFVGMSAVDPTLVQHEGKWWMFLNKKDGNYLSFKDELYLYYADSPFSDKWISHPQNPVVTDVRSARSAGKIYKTQGHLIRPAQDCSVEYGYRIRQQKIIKMNEEEYSEAEFGIIEPNYDKNICGMHTLAKHNEFTVLDCKLRTSKLPAHINIPFLSW